MSPEDGGSAGAGRGLSNVGVLAVAGLGRHGGDDDDDGGSDDDDMSGFAARAALTVTKAGAVDPNTLPKGQGDGGFICGTDPGSLLRHQCAFDLPSSVVPSEWVAEVAKAASNLHRGYVPQVQLSALGLAVVFDRTSCVTALLAATTKLYTAAAEVAAAADAAAAVAVAGGEGFASAIAIVVVM